MPAQPAAPTSAAPVDPTIPPAGVECDVIGCAHTATKRSTEKDVDEQATARPELKPRPALPNLFVCDHHRNWPHSNDAKRWVLDNENKYAARGK